MNLTALGLALNFVGVVALGWLVPPNVVFRVGTGTVGFKNAVGRWSFRLGWGCLIIGIVLQFVAVT